MELRLKPDLESQLKEQASRSGRTPDELVTDIVAAYLAEVSELRAALENRWGAYKRGEAEVLDGEEAYKELRARATESVKRHSIG
jgi:predicted DNA-binding protein